MKHNAPLVIFDWDGTLVDSIGIISQTLVDSATTLGASLTLNSAKQVIGLGLPQADQALFPKQSLGFHQQFVAQYKALFVGTACEPMPFPGAMALLQELHVQGFGLAIATGKARFGLDRALRVSGLQDFFTSTRCADETKSKPHPLMIYEILAEMNHSQQPVFMVGDTTHDLFLAHNAGVTAVAITTGAHSKQQLQLANPHCLCENLDQVARFIHRSV